MLRGCGLNNLEFVWWWAPRKDDPQLRYGEPPGLVVGKIVAQVTQRDVKVSITHSVHPSFAVGNTYRRCRMKTRDCVLVDGTPQDRQTGKEVMPRENEKREVQAEGNEDAAFRPEKYNVVKNVGGTLHTRTKGSFVLMPEKDPAALQALKAYMASCQSPQLRQELSDWIKKIEKTIVPQWTKGEHLGSMGRINAGLDKLV